jgi:hypothetical protein
MPKLVFVCWDPSDRPRAARGPLFLDTLAPQLLKAGADQLSVLVADDGADVRSPNPFPLFERRSIALVNVWSEADPEAFLAILRAEGLDVAGYAVEASVYRDYGDNAHAAPRSWPDGERSPGVTAVTYMERPAHLSHDEWMRRWHGNMSPVSEGIQPRTRYVRNVVTAKLTPDAPDFAGIVEEAWPSPRHVTNPFLFYGASNPWQLLVNIGRILAAVTAFLTLWRVRTVMMSEWFVRTDG